MAGNGGQVPGNGRVGLFGLTAAQHGNVAVAVNVDGVGGVLHADLDGLAQQIHVTDGAPTIGGVHKGLGLGRRLVEVLIGFLLIFETAHETAAGAGNLGGIQAQILGFGHLDGNRLEVIQELGAAEGPSADAQTAHHAGLVPDADLPQFDAGAENGGQILYQLPEIHPAVGGEEEEDFAAVKGALRRNQLHVQLVFLNFLETDGKGLLFLFVVVGGNFFIVGRGHAQDGPQGRHHIGGGHRVAAAGAEAELRTTGRVDNHMVAHFGRQIAGVKIINLAAGAEADVHHRYLFRQRLGVLRRVRRGNGQQLRSQGVVHGLMDRFRLTAAAARAAVTAAAGGLGAQFLQFFLFIHGKLHFYPTAVGGEIVAFSYSRASSPAQILPTPTLAQQSSNASWTSRQAASSSGAVRCSAMARAWGRRVGQPRRASSD